MRNDSPSVRLAVIDDLDALQDVYRRASLSNDGDRPNLLAHPELLDLDPTGLHDGRTIAAIDQGTVVGFATFSHHPEHVELEALFVDPIHRRRGHALRLVNAVVDTARRRRCGARRGHRQRSRERLLRRGRVRAGRHGGAAVRTRPAQAPGGLIVFTVRRAIVGGWISVCVALVGGCSSDGDVQRSDWWLSENVDGTRLDVVTYVGSGSCTEFDRVHVEESAEDVLIEAYVTVQGNDCTDDYTWASTQVELDDPLGDRALTGCVAPANGNRAPDLPHDDSACADLVRPDYAGTVVGDYPTG